MEQSVQPLDGADAQVSELRSMLEAANQRADEAEKKSAENFEGWQRERADFNNFRKRIERDQAQAASNLTGDIAKKYHRWCSMTLSAH
jgi:molecular chaperone GrpE